MPIYMKYGDIKGDVTEDTHKEWVELDSFNWGVGRSISSPTGASADRVSSSPSISEITVAKRSDAASPKLLNEALKGEGKDVQIDFCKTESGDMQIFTTFTLTNCMVSGYSVNGSGDRSSESLSLNFTKVEYKNIPSKAAGEAASPETVTYDLSAAKVV